MIQGYQPESSLPEDERRTHGNPVQKKETKPPALEFRQVSYQYPSEDFDIIDRLSFTVQHGSFHCIVGVSGCGKSTIFRMVNGLLKPKAGEILTDGRPVGSQKKVCGYMPQKDLLFPWRTIGENLALPLEIEKSLSGPERKERIEKALEEVGLPGLQDKMPEELSGGMRQRAAFARTMLTGSDLLLLDEPFSALDFLTRIAMQEWLLEVWQKHKKTILFITHDVEEALFLSQSVLAVTDTPIHELTEVPVPVGMPRTRECLAEPGMVKLKEDLIGVLRKQVKE